MPDGFGRLAWVYEGLERLVYGSLLQRARLALIDDLVGARHVLILGEGDGRFVLALLQRKRTCSVTVLEHSPGMVRRAEARIAKHLLESQTRITFRQEDALSAEFAEGRYDAVVTHFFLDVFGEAQVPRLVEKLTACLRPGGLWLISDFAHPSSVEAGLPRLLSRLLLPLMYSFFRITTQLQATKLLPPQPYLQAVGLRLKRLERFDSGFVHAELWQKPEIGCDSTKQNTTHFSPHRHHGGGQIVGGAGACRAFPQKCPPARRHLSPDDRQGAGGDDR